MITLYSTNSCAYCPAVKKLLDHYKAEYQEVKLDDRPDIRQALIDKTGFLTVPVTTDGETYIPGFHPEQIADLVRKQAINE